MLERQKCKECRLSRFSEIIIQVYCKPGQMTSWNKDLFRFVFAPSNHLGFSLKNYSYEIPGWKATELNFKIPTDRLCYLVRCHIGMISRNTKQLNNGPRGSLLHDIYFISHSCLTEHPHVQNHWTANHLFLCCSCSLFVFWLSNFRWHN